MRPRRKRVGTFREVIYESAEMSPLTRHSSPTLQGFICKGSRLPLVDVHLEHEVRCAVLVRHFDSGLGRRVVTGIPPGLKKRRRRGGGADSRRDHREWLAK